VANFESTPRIGRAQGASIFWGLVSAFFATAFCIYYWKSIDNDQKLVALNDTVQHQQELLDTLNSQKQEMQSSLDDQKKQLDLRDEFLQEKEAKLAQEETKLESQGVQVQGQSQQTQSQATAVKKFDDTVRKISKATDSADVVARAGRPVLRVPAASLFATGDATLTHDGKALLNQIAQAVDGQLDNFELRIDTFTDGDAEVAPAADKTGDKPDKTDSTAKPHFASGWELTAARATAISRYFRDQTSLPFQNVVVVARGDFQPIVGAGKDGHARNRRVEITISPEAPAYHPPDTSTTTTVSSSDKSSPDKTVDKKPAAPPVNPLTPPPDPPASGNKGN
jgi:chemotaxis protein MotB